MPGSNGVAFDRRGNLWVTDLGIGRDVRGLPPGTITITESGRQASNTLDDDENIFASVNERNAIAVVTDEGRAVEYFRNPVAGGVRNAGPLEFPTSPVLVGRTLCTTNSDVNRRDNSPIGPGEGSKVNCVG